MHTHLRVSMIYFNSKKYFFKICKKHQNSVNLFWMNLVDVNFQSLHFIQQESQGLIVIRISLSAKKIIIVDQSS